MPVDQNIKEDKDPVLWELASKRAGFKIHALVYSGVNALLWALWFFSSGDWSNHRPWPLWTTIGWGIGLAFHFANAYVFSGIFSVEKEYQKLKNKQS